MRLKLDLRKSRVVIGAQPRPLLTVYYRSREYPHGDIAQWSFQRLWCAIVGHKFGHKFPSWDLSHKSPGYSRCCQRCAARSFGEEDAAQVCEKRAEERFLQYGTREDDTNATYYNELHPDEYQIRDEEDEACAAELREKRIAELAAAVKEWLCLKCNTVYQGPPQEGIWCVMCPKCGGETGPRDSIKLTVANKRIAELEASDAYTTEQWLRDNASNSAANSLLRERLARVTRAAKAMIDQVQCVETFSTDCYLKADALRAALAEEQEQKPCPPSQS